MASEGTCGTMGSKGGGCRKMVQGSVGAAACWPAGLLVTEREHENERTWPLRETPLEGVRTFRGKGHLLSQGQTAEIVWVKSVK